MSITGCCKLMRHAPILLLLTKPARQVVQYIPICIGWSDAHNLQRQASNALLGKVQCDGQVQLLQQLFLALVLVQASRPTQEVAVVNLLIVITPVRLFLKERFTGLPGLQRVF
jgi:hypothetical protein